MPKESLESPETPPGGPRLSYTTPAKAVGSRRHFPIDEEPFFFSQNQVIEIGKKIGANVSNNAHQRFFDQICFLINTFRTANRKSIQIRGADVRKEMKLMATHARKLASDFDDSTVANEIFTIAAPQLIPAFSRNLESTHDDLFKIAFPQILDGYPEQFKKTLLDFAEALETAGQLSLASENRGRPADKGRENFVDKFAQEYEIAFAERPPRYRDGPIEEFLRTCLKWSGFEPGDVHQLLIDSHARLFPEEGGGTP